ncbi:dihydrolipoamide acetyltransferase family protein [Polymorphospora sp. NPDC051019]|uniref:dihydrolipoamide acetyltransferase family protein n=1 Tax=Polymorphospora sp. NPDC051019 TaxID=3155725 RepID=UPI0034242DD5
MSRVFNLPDLGEGLTEAEIVSWRVAVGDTVTVDQIVVEVETAKAVVDVPCPYAGRVVALHGTAGESRPVGQPLVTIAPLDVAGGSPDAGLPGDGRPEPPGHAAYREQERAGSGNVLIGYGTGHAPNTRRRRRVGTPPVGAGAGAGVGSSAGFRAGSSAGSSTAPRMGSSAGPRVDQGEIVGDSSAPGHDFSSIDAAGAGAVRVGAASVGAGAGAALVISPLVRRLARERGIDLTTVRGTGPGGIVRRADVEEASTAASSSTVLAAAPSAPTPAAAPAVAAVSGAAEDDVVVPLRGVRKAVADKLSRSRREIPDVTIWVDVDATGLLDTRAAINAANPEQPVSVLALLARVCLAGLRRYPDLNSRVDTGRGEIVRSGRVHLGIAAQTDRGLVVPVIADAHRMTTTELAAELARTTADARAGTLPPARLTGGTFTLNNYGVFGVDGSTPIINHPEAALLGVGRIVDKPWVVDGQLAVRKVGQLSLTFDHRVCDGGVAGGFLRFVADCVEQPAVLIANV